MSAEFAANYPESLRARRDPRTGRFAGLDPIPLPGFGKLLQWHIGLGPKDPVLPLVSEAARAPAPRVAPDLARLRAPDPAAVQLTWIGHSTWLIQAAGVNLVTDPIWSTHCGPLPLPRLKRASPPGVAFADLPPVHGVVLSHAHFDHCDVPTLRRFGAAPEYAVPSGLAPLVRRCGGVRVQEAEWGQVVQLGAVRLTFLPAQHFSARSPFDRNVALWGGWLIEAAGRRIYFAADTGNAPFLAELGRWLGGVDLAILPIGAYSPRWFMRPVHCDPAGAVQIHREVGARRSLATHWGTFSLADEPLGEPPVALRAALAEAKIPEAEFRLPSLGETFVV